MNRNYFTYLYKVLILILNIGFCSTAYAQYFASNLRVDRLEANRYSLHAYLVREIITNDTPTNSGIFGFYIYDPVNKKGEYLGRGEERNYPPDDHSIYRKTQSELSIDLNDSSLNHYDSLDYFYLIYSNNSYGSIHWGGTTFNDDRLYGEYQQSKTIAIVYHGNYKFLDKKTNSCVKLDTISYGQTFDALYDSPGVWDEDGDSLSIQYTESISVEIKYFVFRFAPGALFGWPTPGFWRDSFSLDYPFYLNCPIKPHGICIKNPNSYPPLGMSFDDFDADLVMGFDDVYLPLRPMEKFPITRKITEWRNDTTGQPRRIGTYYLTKWFNTKRASELHKLGVSYQNQSSRFVSNDDKFYHFVGDTIDYDFKTTKATFLGRKRINQLFWNREFDGSTFTITNPDNLNKTLHIHWIPTSKYAGKNSNPLALYVLTDSSSIDTLVYLSAVGKQMNSKTVHFFISNRHVANIQLDSQICNHFYLSTDKVDAFGNWHYDWQLLSENGDTLQTASGLKIHLLAPKSGRYKINVKIWGELYHTTFSHDTTVNINSTIDVLLPDTAFLCTNECITLKPKVNKAHGAVRHIWDNGNILQDAPTYTVCDTGMLIRLSSTDDSGCTALNQVYIPGKDTLPFSLGADTLLCSGSYVQVRIPHYDEKINFVWQDGNQKDSIRVFSAPAVISAQIQGENGCWSFDHKLLNHPTPPSDSVRLAGNRCPGQQVLLEHQQAWEILLPNTTGKSMEIIIPEIRLALPLRQISIISSPCSTRPADFNAHIPQTAVLICTTNRRFVLIVHLCYVKALCLFN